MVVVAKGRGTRPINGALWGRVLVTCAGTEHYSLEPSETAGLRLPVRPMEARQCSKRSTY